jgi:hypothetical protein
MKRRLPREAEVVVKVVESKKCFKLRVLDDARLKTVANQLSRLLGLNPQSSEWAFYAAGDQRYELPIATTVNQVALAGEPLVLLAKLMTATQLETFVRTTADLRLDTRWRRRIESCDPRRRDFGSQTGEQSQEGEAHWFDSQFGHWRHATPVWQGDAIAKPRPAKVRYTLAGIEDPLRVPAKPKTGRARSTADIWAALNTVETSGVLRGLNAVGYCANEQCANFERWLLVGLGFGRFSSRALAQIAQCELCPHKDMCKRPFTLVGMFFKECRWTIESAQTVLLKPNPLELEAWRGRTKRVDLAD